jgi:transposase
MTGSLLQRAYTWLEPDEGKLSCPVLRGGSVSNDALLPDFNGLYGLVRDHLECDPQSGHVYLFTNTRRNRLKLLVWDNSGLWVCAKKLDKGCFHWPKTDIAVSKIVLSHEELALLLGGIDLAETRRRRWYRKVSGEESDKLRNTA